MITSQVIPKILTPVQISSRISKRYALETSKKYKKQQGQFFTDSKLAESLCSLILIDNYNTVLSILDPGCGSLSLSCALIEKIVNESDCIRTICIDAYDTDGHLLSIVENNIEQIRIWADLHEVEIIINLQHTDFLHNDYDSNNESKKYDLIISNPPYFKIKKEDDRLNSFPVLKGQQNIYSLFLLASSKLLESEGKLLFIIPRSFTSGTYFQSFREYFFSDIQLSNIHLFDSRTDGFESDDVLQESLFLVGTRKIGNEDYYFSLSTSNGVDDFHNRYVQNVSFASVYKEYKQLTFLHLPVNNEQLEAIAKMNEWEITLEDLKMKAFTGHVVPFRAKGYTRLKRSRNTVPLLWMHNFNRVELTWPLKVEGKPQYIKPNKHTSSKTIDTQNCILVRRLSFKDDKHRVICKAIKGSQFEYNQIGIENHISYIVKTDIQMSDAELVGLAAYLNSDFFEAFYRSLSGHTQVNTTDLNSIPMPGIGVIRNIGCEIISGAKENADTIVQKYINGK